MQGVQIAWDTLSPAEMVSAWETLTRGEKRQAWDDMSRAQKEALAKAPPHGTYRLGTSPKDGRHDLTNAQMLEWEGVTVHPVATHFSDYADMVKDAVAMFRLEISVADHRNCQGGDFDPCTCMTSPAFAAAQLARVVRLERGLAIIEDKQKTIAGRRQEARQRDEVEAYAEAHPEESKRYWDNVWD